MTAHTDEAAQSRLQALEQALVSHGSELAVYLVYDRPARAAERPGLARTFFAQRCVSDLQLTQTIEAFRDVGAYVELFEGERPLLEALASERLQRVDRTIKVIYNGIEGGIAFDGFAPGRKALIPSVADSYGVVCANSNAYACALGRHKFHYFTILQTLGLRVPETWHFRAGAGWAAGRAPTRGSKVIAKSTYESWSVGVTEESVFVVDEDCEERVAAIADRIGQPVTVQNFVSGPEICVPIFSVPDLIVTPPVEIVLAKAPGDGDAVITIDDNVSGSSVGHRPYLGARHTMKQLHEATINAFDLLQLDAFARIDFRVDDQGNPWIVDVGVSPGVSAKSSSFRSVEQWGFDHAAFLRVVVAASLATAGVLA